MNKDIIVLNKETNKNTQEVKRMIKIPRETNIKDMTEKQLLRFKMEKIASHVEGPYLGEEGKSLAKMYATLRKLNERFIIGIVVFLYSCIGFVILVTKLFRSKA